jgi:predicted TIM-barrel fold metal-dependent hydrolase
MPTPLTPEWYDQVIEEVIDPDRTIVDPHHHLWPPGGALPYGIDALRADLDSGHRVVRTVFIECGAAYRTGGPAHLAPVGETEFVAATAASDPDHLIGGIVAHADLADLGHLDEVLDAHEEAGAGLVKGIRHQGARDPDPGALAIPGPAPAGLYADPDFRRGLARLGRRSWTFDAWHYHHQQADFIELARAVPDTLLVLDHFGTPLGVGAYAGHGDEIFDRWRTDVVELARCGNVVAKLGGMAMPDNGYAWHRADRPPTSDEFLDRQRRYFDVALEAFGPERCMFESNFPVDRFSISYRTLWNAFKKLAAPLAPGERDALFVGTATRTYRLG